MRGGECNDWMRGRGSILAQNQRSTLRPPCAILEEQRPTRLRVRNRAPYGKPLLAWRSASGSCCLRHSRAQVASMLTASARAGRAIPGALQVRGRVECNRDISTVGTVCRALSRNQCPVDLHIKLVHSSFGKKLAFQRVDGGPESADRLLFRVLYGSRRQYCTEKLIASAICTPVYESALLVGIG